MRIVRMICDRCYVEEIEDDADDWHETKDGRDLCASCYPPRRKRTTTAAPVSGVAARAKGDGDDE